MKIYESSNVIGWWGFQVLHSFRTKIGLLIKMIECWQVGFRAVNKTSRQELKQGCV